MYEKRYQGASSRIHRRNQNRKFFKAFLKLAPLFILFFSTLWLLRADFLLVKNFQVESSDQDLNQNIKNLALSLLAGNKFGLIPKSNLFLVDVDELALEIKKQFPKLDNLKIKRGFFDQTLYFEARERSGEFWLCQNEAKCYLVDDQGIIFEELPSPIPENSKVVFKTSLEEGPLPRELAPATLFESYKKIISDFKTAGILVHSVVIQKKDYAFLETEFGKVIFNPEEITFRENAQKAILLIAELKNKNPGIKFDYIDTRFGQKLFYKTLN